jgi:hypothetical protein
MNIYAFLAVCAGWEILAVLCRVDIWAVFCRVLAVRKMLTLYLLFFFLRFFNLFFQINDLIFAGDLKPLHPTLSLDISGKCFQLRFLLLVVNNSFEVHIDVVVVCLTKGPLLGLLVLRCCYSIEDVFLGHFGLLLLFFEGNDFLLLLHISLLGALIFAILLADHFYHIFS